jgi:hypothetical protein
LFAALLSLVKATFLFASFTAFLIAGVYLLAKKMPGRLARAAGLYGLALAAGYLLCGQDVREAAGYVAAHFAVGLPYPEGMRFPVFSLIGVDKQTVVTQMALLVIFAVMSVFFLIHSRNRAKTLAKGLLCWMFFMLVWKHGLTRHPHEIVHWALATLPVMGCLAGDPGAPLFAKWREQARWRWAREDPSLALGAAVFVTSLLLIVLASGISPVPNFTGKNIHAFVAPRSRAGYESELARLRGQHALPSMRAIIGKGCVDALGQNQHRVFHNDFRYTPRPMFQSYSAYSEKLIQANHAFLKSKQAPEFMILDMETIDNRLPLQSDSLAWLEVANAYEWVCDENNASLWRRRADGGNHRLHLDGMTGGTARLMEFASLPKGPAWLRLNLRLSPFGEAQKLLGWSPIFFIDVKMQNGSLRSFRLIRDAARAGFVISPLVMTRGEFRRFANSLEGNELAEFRVRASNALCANPEYDYEISMIKNSRAE